MVAIGINISKLAGLGISPVSSIPRALELITELSLGKMTIIVYCLLVILQYLILRKAFMKRYIFQIPVAIAFGYVVDIFGIDPKAIGHLLEGISKPQHYFLKIVYLFVSIVIIGIGVYIYLKQDLIPMPAEGVALAVSKKSGREIGDSKTLVDISLILIALILQLLFLGGLRSFTVENVVVREGTLLSAILVGQVVKLLKKVFD